MSQCKIHLTDGTDLWVEASLEELTGALQRDTFATVIVNGQKVAIRGGQVISIHEMSEGATSPLKSV